jgi:hypothetical protein
MKLGRAGRGGDKKRRGDTGARLLPSMTFLAASAVLLAACGGSPSASPDTTSRPSAGASTSTSRPVSSSDPPRAAVLAAYRAASQAFQQALATANPADPKLAETMVDPQLQSVRANLVADQAKGIVGKGAVTLHPKLRSLSGTKATVVDCAYSTSELVYQSTGKPVPPVTPPENDGVRATLVQVGGTWKLSKQVVTEGKCAPGS